jgi:hypothetical protein
LEGNHPDNACNISGVQSSARGQVVDAEREQQDIAPQIEFTPFAEGKWSGYGAVEKPGETNIAERLAGSGRLPPDALSAHGTHQW